MSAWLHYTAFSIECLRYTISTVVQKVIIKKKNKTKMSSQEVQ